MSNTLEQEVFGDYAALLRTLLPQSRGFVFHNRDGQVLWHDDSVDISQLDTGYLENLRAIVVAGSIDEHHRCHDLAGSNVFLFELNSMQGHVLGFVALVLEPAFNTMDWDDCSQRIHSALRSLCRELSLRIKVQEISNNVSVQNSQYDFLRDIETITRSKKGCQEAISDLINLCKEQFVLDGAVLYLPEHKLNVIGGRKPVSELEAEMLFESLVAGVDGSDKPLRQACAERHQADPRARTRAWPVLVDDHRLSGVLILSKPASTVRWGIHTENLAGFVISAVERIIEHSFDALTGLANWNDFESSLTRARNATATDYAVMYFDMDQLHVVNDTFGRSTGDQVLSRVGAILREILDGHMVARVTSDSFAALVSDCSLEEGERFGKLVCEALRRIDFSHGAKTHRPTVSIGIAELDREAAEDKDALAHAQVACQAAKDRGRDRVEIYHSADASIVRRMDDISLIGALRSAVDSGQLVLYAQPIVPVTGTCADENYELLVRLLDDDGNPIAPAKFLGTAERYQLIQDIDRWVVSKALEALAKQPRTASGRNLRFAVNLSGQSLGNEAFLEYVQDQIPRYDVEPGRLSFEITETVAVSNQAKAQNFMRELKKLGCKFSLDDFGTGLSSFAYLKLFAVDKIKIDGSFVHDICENEVSRAMVSAIAEIARVMGVETVAEYVQDAQSMEVLAELGVDWAQGFHVGQPFRLNKLISDGTNAAPEEESEYVDTMILTALPV